MLYRFAKKDDVSRIVDLHFDVRDFYSVGFFSKTRKCFLKAYYNILINDPNEIILCAVENNEIRGFCTGSLNVEKQHELFKKKKIILGLSLLSTILLNPKIIFDIIKRYSSLKYNSQEKYIIKKGARSEYWTWCKNGHDSEFSVELLNKFYNIFFICGINEVIFEVDELNKKIVKIHLLNGATIIEKIMLPDNRSRILMKYDLIKKFS